VVVVELAGTAGVVVVLVVVVAGVEQPDSDAMAMAAKHARIIFFIGMFFLVCCFTGTKLRHRLVRRYGV
jgi:hypothetical protein